MWTEEFFLFLLDSCCLQQQDNARLLTESRLKAYMKKKLCLKKGHWKPLITLMGCSMGMGVFPVESSAL